MIYRWTRKFFITIVGFVVLGIGLILIPLPGPGLLVCALGLAILTLEYDWAGRRLETTRNQLKKIIDQSKAKSDKREE